MAKWSTENKDTIMELMAQHGEDVQAFADEACVALPNKTRAQILRQRSYLLDAGIFKQKALTTLQDLYSKQEEARSREDDIFKDLLSSREKQRGKVTSSLCGIISPKKRKHKDDDDDDDHEMAKRIALLHSPSVPMPPAGNDASSDHPPTNRGVPPPPVFPTHPASPAPVHHPTAPPTVPAAPLVPTTPPAFAPPTASASTTPSTSSVPPISARREAFLRHALRPFSPPPPTQQESTNSLAPPTTPRSVPPAFPAPLPPTQATSTPFSPLPQHFQFYSPPPSPFRPSQFTPPQFTPLFAFQAGAPAQAMSLPPPSLLPIPSPLPPFLPPPTSPLSVLPLALVPPSTETSASPPPTLLLLPPSPSAPPQPTPFHLSETDNTR